MSRSDRICKKGRLSKAELEQDDRPYVKAAEKFMETIGRHYEEYLAKFKKMIILKNMGEIDLVDDIMNDTILLCYDAVSRNDLRDSTEQGIKNYFFRAFKMNYTVKSSYDKRKDGNVDVVDLLINETDEDNQLQNIKKDYYVMKICEMVEENFDEETFNIWKYKLLNNVTYKQLRDIYPNVDKQKKRVSEVNSFVKGINVDMLEDCFDEYQRNLDII